MVRTIRVVQTSLIALAVALGLWAVTVPANAAQAVAPAAPAAFTPSSCPVAQQQDASTAGDVSRFERKLKKAKRSFRAAKKVNNRQPTAAHKKAVTKAKKKKKSARKKLDAARQRQQISSNSVVIYCGTPGSASGSSTGSAGSSGQSLPAETPGVSPLAPLCAVAPGLAPLCDATTALGSAAILAPVCQAVPQLAALCAVRPGDLANPLALQALLDQLSSALGQDPTLLTVIQGLLDRLLAGDASGVLDQVQMTPAALENVLSALLGALR